MGRTVTPLRRAIFDSGRTQRDVAQEIGLSEATLSRIVNGLHADAAVQAKIAAALGCPVVELFPVHDSVIGTAGETVEAP